MRKSEERKREREREKQGKKEDEEQEDCREGGREYFRGIGGGGTSSLPLPVPWIETRLFHTIIPTSCTNYTPATSPLHDLALVR